MPPWKSIITVSCVVLLISTAAAASCYKIELNEYKQKTTEINALMEKHRELSLDFDRRAYANNGRGTKVESRINELSNEFMQRDKDLQKWYADTIILRHMKRPR